MAADRPCMVALPGDSASSDLVVTNPYTTAKPAQTRATTTPKSDRKSVKETPLKSRKRAPRARALLDKAKRQPCRAAA
jgi:hypothetical protein